MESSSISPTSRAADLPAVRGSRLPSGRALTSGEVIALFAACAADRSAAGARDAAAFALMYGAGLRRSEAADLQLADYDPDTGAITLIGKGNKERKVYAINGGATALNAWIAHRGKEPGPLLHSVNKAGDIDRSRGITSQALMYRLKVRCRQAAIAECSPHDLRRSFVSELLDAGADISAVQTLAGHASTDTTARYDRRGEKAARRAANMIHVPYTPLAPSPPDKKEASRIACLWKPPLERSSRRQSGGIQGHSLGFHSPAAPLDTATAVSKWRDTSRPLRDPCPSGDTIDRPRLSRILCAPSTRSSLLTERRGILVAA